MKVLVKKDVWKGEPIFSMTISKLQSYLASLAAAVSRLAATPLEERIKMGRNGIEVSSAEFNRSILINHFEFWFGQLKNQSSDAVVANKKCF